MKYVILCGLVIAWCAVHSAMISTGVTEYLQMQLGRVFRFYRLFFNIVAALTLLPVVLYAQSVRTEPLLDWSGYMRPFQVLLLGTAALLFFLGARRYDAAQFLGLKQVRGEQSGRGISGSGELDISGILGVMRHPWYCAGILLVWARPLDISAILVNAVLTSYLIIGAFLEEQKLLRAFGEQYRTYQSRVSMLFPLKWLKSKKWG
jgi:methanethiol S-methyltransferase